MPDPVKAIRVQVNGRQVEEYHARRSAPAASAGEQIFDVPLAKGRNEVRVTLTNAIGEKAETLLLNHEGDGDLDKRGTLYILAIGVDKYPGMGNTCGNGTRAATCALLAPMREPGRRPPSGGSVPATPRWSSGCWSTARATRMPRRPPTSPMPSMLC